MQLVFLLRHFSALEEINVDRIVVSGGLPILFLIA